MKSNSETARIVFRYCGGLAALFMIMSGRIEAQQLKQDEKPTMQITYLQNENEYLVFKINVNNTGTRKTTLSISDINHDVIFSDAISNNYSKIVKVPKYELETIEFRLSYGREVIRKIFEVKLTTKEMLEVTESTPN
jgi:hypothetical protein